MVRIRTLLAGLIVAATGFLAVPALASAATRFATPTGSGTTCSQAAPCGLVTAVNNAGPGDEIVVAGNQGTYGTPASPIGTQLNDAGSINLHGAAGQPMPVIYSNASFAVSLNNGGTASDLDIEELNAGGEGIFVGNEIDHMLVHSASSACEPAPDVTLTDVVCFGKNNGLGAGSASSGTQTITLRNVSAVSGPSGSGISLSASGYNQVVNATNVIARGGIDIATGVFSGGTMAFTLDHSNYATTSGPGITAAGSGTNQTAAPAFANASSGDLHQTGASPTIDHGADSPANGTTDFEGKPRTFGAHTDIGADEYAPPSVLSESAASITTQSAVLGGSVNTEGGPANAHIDLGTTTAYGTSVALGAPALSAAPQSVTAAVGSLAASTTYHFRIVVGNGSGTVDGPDQTFTTAANPPTKATISQLRETNRVFTVGHASTPLNGLTTARRHKRGTTFVFALDKPATIKIAIKQRLPGRRVHGACKRSTPRLRHKPRCLRNVTKVVLTRTGHGGMNKVAFSGRIHGHALRPGSYIAVFTAIDSAGSSRSQTVAFRIVKR